MYVDDKVKKMIMYSHIKEVTYIYNTYRGGSDAYDYIMHCFGYRIIYAMEAGMIILLSLAVNLTRVM